jgi:UDP-N-acetylmuramyl pentapeptide phosphotransferase/UDP-N-acetylglucosamine-1-phosphate transferase
MSSVQFRCLRKVRPCLWNNYRCQSNVLVNGMRNLRIYTLAVLTICSLNPHMTTLEHRNEAKQCIVVAVGTAKMGQGFGDKWCHFPPSLNHLLMSQTHLLPTRKIYMRQVPVLFLATSFCFPCISFLSFLIFIYLLIFSLSVFEQEWL